MKTPFPQHGLIRGLNDVPRSTSFEGRFGRMFRTLPPAQFSEDALAKLARAITAEREDPPTPETEVDGEENTGISAGFTYLGQFIDHDLTFDPASSLQKQNDPAGLVDFRSPRFDLDSVYGRGPDDQPCLYADDHIRLLLGRKLRGNPRDAHTRDVPRSQPAAGPRRAIIGDPRNDENVIVSQLHSVFMRFHNAIADALGKAADFETAQRFTRWHYQWAIIHDFLPTIISQGPLHTVFPHLQHGTSIAKNPPRLRFFHWRNEPFMPVEFSVAAYRFGHSMVRPQYRLNTTLRDRFEIFSADEHVESLVGFREYPAEFAIDWTLYFAFPGVPTSPGPKRVQPAYKIDSSLVNPLGSLPPSVATKVSSLAQRNLLRGLRLGLPSGQAVARVMGEDVIDDHLLLVGKATEEDHADNVPLTSISAEFGHNAPLWFYVLAEAQQQFVTDATPIRLGPVGGRIVAEVFAGLLLGDRHSFVNQNPDWQPFEDFKKNGRFGVSELIAVAQQAKDTKHTHTIESGKEEAEHPVG